MDDPGVRSRYAVPLEQLERSVHVPVEDQRTDLAEAPAEPVRGEWETEVSWLLRSAAG